MRRALAPDDPRHGTHSSYCNYGCRCDPCRLAENEYKRKRYQPRDHEATYRARVAAQGSEHICVPYEPEGWCNVCLDDLQAALDRYKVGGWAAL